VPAGFAAINRIVFADVKDVGIGGGCAASGDRVLWPWRIEDLPQHVRDHRYLLRTRLEDGPSDNLTPPRGDLAKVEIEDALRQSKGSAIVAAKIARGSAHHAVSAVQTVWHRN
jgi:hypothetical protein